MTMCNGMTWADDLMGRLGAEPLRCTADTSADWYGTGARCTLQREPWSPFCSRWHDDPDACREPDAMTPDELVGVFIAGWAAEQVAAQARGHTPRTHSAQAVAMWRRRAALAQLDLLTT